MIKIQSHDNMTLSSKGQKIIAALYLVTNHLPEGDPMRFRLRECAVALADAPFDERFELTATILSLLGAASLGGLISERNVKVLETEVRHFADPLAGDDGLAALFPPAPVDKGHFILKRTSHAQMSFTNGHTDMGVSEKKQLNIDNKGKRQEKILSYINDRKSANIKDISSLFPDVSEKTIQRELGTLVALGKISKRGNKRWSIYLAVS